jgi:hypothetical protein
MMIQWQPPSAEELVNYWRERYPNAQVGILEHLANAKLILMNQNDGLATLQGLQQQMGNRPLDDSLADIEQQQGFQRREVVQDLLSRDDFQAHLRIPRHIFDVGTPFDHGPHTHRLQGYILYQAHVQNQLRIAPSVLYQELGKLEFQDPKNPLRTIWDDIFDFDDEARDVLKLKKSVDESMIHAAFSSPEWTLKFLISQQFPGGALQQELRLIRFRQRTFGTRSILDMKQALLAKIRGDDVLAQMQVDQLEELYQQRVDPQYFQKRDRALAGQ